MANNLSIPFQGTGTPYVIIRRVSDGAVWNGTSFATWADGSIATYVVALTNLSGDLWSADFPSTISAGDYRPFFYYRTGASATITDYLLRSYVRHWSGETLAEEAELDLSSFALTTLESIKRRMGIEDTDSDTVLTEYINQVSSLIERVTGVRFKARDYRQWIDGNDQRQITLPNFPIQHVTRIGFGLANALTVTYAGSGIRANASVYRDPESADAGGLRLVSVSTSGVKTTNNLSFATYGSVSSLVTAANLISGWTAATSVNIPTGDLHRTGGENALNRTITLTYPDLDEYAYSVDYDSGLVRFHMGCGIMGWWGGKFGVGATGAGVGKEGFYNPAAMPHSFQGVLVEYRAGYETIPADVALKANEIIADKFYEGEVGRGVNEIKIGPYVAKYDQSLIDDIRTDLLAYIDLSQMIGGSR